MRGDEPDGATLQLCLLPSGCPPAALAVADAMSDPERLSVADLAAAAAGVGLAVVVVDNTSLLGVERTSVSAAAAGDVTVTVTSPADADTATALSLFLADKSITSGSHNFFT